MEIQTLILDLDGPLLEGRQRHYACYSQILRENGYTPLPLETYWEMKRERLCLEKQLAATGAGDLLEKFRRSWQARIEEPDLLALDVVQAGAREKLQAWHAEGRTLLLATLRHNATGLHTQLEQLDLARFFTAILVCRHADGGRGKALTVRNSSAWRQSQEKAGASRSLWLGDTEIDIEAARFLGCEVCAVSSGLRTAEYLATQKPDYLITDLADLELSAIVAPALPENSVTALP